MSLYLIYFEINRFQDYKLKKKPEYSLLDEVSKMNADASLKYNEIVVKIKGKQNPIKGLVIHDGIASDWFLKFGKDAISRQGNIYRKLFSEFIFYRMDEFSIKPYFIFKNFKSDVFEINIDLIPVNKVNKVDLADNFYKIKAEELIEVY